MSGVRFATSRLVGAVAADASTASFLLPCLPELRRTARERDPSNSVNTLYYCLLWNDFRVEFRRRGRPFDLLARNRSYVSK